METPDTIEDIESLLTASDPPPKLQKLSKMPAGQMVTTMMDAAGVEMTEAERQEIAIISDDEAMAAFLEANLGTEPFIGEMKARGLFGSYMMKKMNHKAIGFAARYMNMASIQKCREFAKSLAMKDGATDEDRINATKIWLLTCREESVLLKRYCDMAQELAPEQTLPKGKNQAPDIFVENANILVQGQPSS